MIKHATGAASVAASASIFSEYSPSLAFETLNQEKTHEWACSYHGEMQQKVTCFASDITLTRYSHHQNAGHQMEAHKKL